MRGTASRSESGMGGSVIRHTSQGLSRHTRPLDAGIGEALRQLGIPVLSWRSLLAAPTPTRRRFVLHVCVLALLVSTVILFSAT